MKKHFISVTTVLTLSASLLFSSCIGSFSLTNRMLSWNQTIGSKFVNELVFFAFWILPVYEVTGLADLLVLNSIEFWSGSNPVAQGTRVIEGHDGRYLVECDGHGYTITSENDGTVTRLEFASADKSWSVTTPSGESYKLMSFVDDAHVRMYDLKGDYKLVELSEEGLMAYKSAAADAMWASTEYQHSDK